MNYLDIFIYGIIQGVTEFFPVSSSGHLALLPRLLELDDPGVFFDLLMHLGTALAVMVYFRKEVKDFMMAALFLMRKKEHPALPWLKNFFVSTVASVVLILILQPFSFQYRGEANLIAFNLIFFGLLMFGVDFICVHNKYDLCDRQGLGRAILIGLAQALAIFPGVSRSGVTLTMGRFLGLGRKEATRYSFILSLPIIFAGVLKELPQMLTGMGQSFDLKMALLGIALSFVVGLLSIHFFLKLIESWGLGIFVFYRLLLGGMILVL